MNKADYIFTRAITDDEDFLLKITGLSEKIKETIFWGVGERQGFYFMKCLQNNYTKEEIMELFNGIDTYTIESNIVQATMKIFKSIPLSLIYDNFKKVNNNFSELNDEFSRLKSMEEDWLKENPERELSTLAVNNVEYIPDGIV